MFRVSEVESVVMISTKKAVLGLFAPSEKPIHLSAFLVTLPTYLVIAYRSELSVVRFHKDHKHGLSLETCLLLLPVAIVLSTQRVRHIKDSRCLLLFAKHIDALRAWCRRIHDEG